MCTFFSFMVDRDGNVYAFLDRDGVEDKYDSHSYIAEYYNIDEDDCWKFDLEFCGESLADFSQMSISELDKFLKDHYDGGLPINEMPATIANSVLDWLISNRDKIVSIGMEMMGDNFWKSQLKKILSEFISSDKKKQVSLYKFPVAFPPGNIPHRLKEYVNDERVIIYVNYTANLVGYMGVALYQHPYVDRDGNIKIEYRANVQLFSVPQPLGGKK